ncbi:MAG TPA: hypothetical protein VGG24_16520 [Paraburkholderia sp.]
MEFPGLGVELNKLFCNADKPRTMMPAGPTRECTQLEKNLQPQIILRITNIYGFLLKIAANFFVRE